MACTGQNIKWNQKMSMFLKEDRNLLNILAEIGDFSVSFKTSRCQSIKAKSTPYAYTGSICLQMKNTSMYFYVCISMNKHIHRHTHKPAHSKGRGINLVDFLRSVCGLRHASGASSLNFQRRWRSQQTASCSITLLTLGHAHLATLSYSKQPHGELTSL